MATANPALHQELKDKENSWSYRITGILKCKNMFSAGIIMAQPTVGRHSISIAYSPYHSPVSIENQVGNALSHFL